MKCRRKRWSLLCLACWALAASASFAGQGWPIVQNFSPGETGGQGYYWCTTQDERGLLYFGCDGVLTFDGERWRQHAVPGSSSVRSLALDSSGRLWTGALNEVGFFERTASGDLSSYQSLVDQLPPDVRNLGDVWHVFAVGQRVVFVTADRVLVWNGSSFRIHHLPGSRRLIAMRVADRVFLSHLSRGLFVLDGDELSLLTSATADAELSVSWLRQTARGWLMLTWRGMVEFADGALSFLGTEASDYLTRHTLTSAAELPTGDLAVGTLGGLLVLSPTGAIKHTLTSAHGLSTTSVFSVFVDRDDALWITSSLGIARVDLTSGTTFFDARHGLVGKPCHAITEHEGHLLVATDDGVFSLALDQETEGTFRPDPELRARFIDLLATNGAVAGLGYKSLTFLRGGAARVVSSGDIWLLRPSYEPSRGFLGVQDYRLARIKLDEDNRPTTTLLARVPDLPIELAEDSAGGVWVGTSSKGAYYADARGSGQLTPVTASDGNQKLGRTLVARARDDVVIASPRGIEIARDHARSLVSIAGAPPTDPIEISNPDAAGNVWIAFRSPFGDGVQFPVVGRLSPNGRGSVEWETFALPVVRSLSDIKTIFVDSRGIVWIGSYAGLLRLDPSRLRPSSPPPPPHVSSSVQQNATLAADQNSARFEFAAVEYGRRDSIRFQTKLNSPGDAWSAPVDSDHFALAGLRDGAYELAVRSVNDAGQTSPATTWRFTILPPWYRTKAAFAAWIALATAGFFGAVQWRSTYLRRRNAQLEELVRKKTEQLEKANAAKSEFLANMSHEIRNPISGILGLSLAMEETPLDERQRKVTESIQSCAKLLSTLVDDVLDFSKIEAGKIDLRPAPFSLRDALDQCVAIVAEDARGAGSSVTVELSPDVPRHVVGDMPRVQQIVLNYLTNAVKFGAGRDITIGAAPRDGDRVRLFVRDQGPGMTAAEIASLFTKFSRLPQSHAANIRGSGLGLAVCRLLATKMGGEVGVDSQPGAGSCFWAEIPLPAARAKTTASPAPITKPLVSADPLHALIVEDIDYNALAMQAVLRRIGIDSEVVGDGLTALEKLRSSYYDVVFMDWNLPGMVGTEVVSRYRAEEPPHRRTIIIATTAYSADFNREACLAAGMDAFIAKPFTPEKIAAALAELRGSFRAAASVEIGTRSEAVPAPPSEISPGFDLQMLRFLADDATGGLPAEIARYFAGFDADVDALRHAVGRGDSGEIHRRAHRCVSHANMVKHEALGRLARELQAHAASQAPGRRGQLLEAFEREFFLFKETLVRSNPSSAPA